jgi:hypothetical protein
MIASSSRLARFACLTDSKQEIDADQNAVFLALAEEPFMSIQQPA